MESPSDGAFRKVFAQNTQDLHIWDHSLPLLGEYRSTTSLKHSEPLHILIGQSNTGHQAMIMQSMESPSDGAFRKVFAQNTHKMSSHSKNTRRDNIRRTKKTRTRSRTNTGTMRGKKYNDNKKKNNNTRRTKMTRTRTRTNNGTMRGKKNKEDKKKNKKSKSKSKNNSKKQEERTRTRRTMITMNQEWYDNEPRMIWLLLEQWLMNKKKNDNEQEPNNEWLWTMNKNKNEQWMMNKNKNDNDNDNEQEQNYGTMDDEQEWY
jgi:hypothetical protein